MAHYLSQASARLYMVLSAFLLTSWTITALGLSALNVLNDNKTFIQSLAAISLFTFLACRLLVLFKPRNPDGSSNGTIAHFIASADYGSRKGALVLFGLCCTWLYELLAMGMLLLFTTLFGGIMATALYQESQTQDGSAAIDNDTRVDASTTSLAEVNEFNAKAGVDLTVFFKWIPPKALVYFVAALWVNFLSLGFYILGHAAKSLVKVLSSPAAAPGASFNVSATAKQVTSGEGKELDSAQ
ncbi:hypothetical protein DTO166G4_5388 [Paecilomyces variotii]|uniref:Uncharacterized protein n=1 Tax=Byssochlamys spectabilis TaxID=264951 RepID=A0A443HWM7_BYSSP|nr:hypothetical protein C8Q69DRAFT_443968 [Paecilomyces variotii]KAJ9213058.1 hypothetical protein DTO166G4_5388 [Paecilomyces variotii]KAJ9230332.1 hypothetical protein DTO169E5_8449 [Paecilomyces variotii]KAJ9234179.1 hypothetical protein DTO166G5_5240 [Paecilomyces variotii]KAJ9267862.1 hypothetical protein DTO195F2_196 [Paecilomyces variotii]KAJ9362546.1 hypothetical protein DTO027B9_223 [Paecilomyces variotii]